MHDLQQICSAARSVVRQATDFLLEQRRSFDASVIEYKGFNDLVSYVDKASERMLVDGLQELIPGAGFITEENTLTIVDREWQWIIDPLDGTTNFIHGIPCYSVSVGLTLNGRLVMGIVHEANLDECFYGWSGGGVFLNDVPVRVSASAALSESLLATGFPYTDFSRMESYMAVFDYAMRNTRGLRRLGSAAVDLAYVACGRFDGFYEYGLSPWDVAGGAFLVREAGGCVTDFSGGDGFLKGREILACNPRIHVGLLEVLMREFKN